MNHIDFSLLYDKSFRQSLKNNPREHLQQIGYENMDDDVAVIVKVNSADTMYIAMAATEIKLESVNAAGALACVGTAACASSAATITSTASTGGCLGSVGTASST